MKRLRPVETREAPMAARKRGHIEAVLSGRAQACRVDAGFDAIRFEPCALPELDLETIDLSTRFLGKPLKLPFLISSMTGGQGGAERINAALAEAAQALGIALGVGSQRIALAEGGREGIDRSLRRRAPDIALYGNIGAAQLQRDFGSMELLRVLEMIEADALIVHLNPLQEALQQGGDVHWSGLLCKIERLCRTLPLPVIVKEVGFGISAGVALRLAGCGVAAIDVAGAGGTSWSAVEGVLSDDPRRAALAEVFRDWGMPTATALREVHAALPSMPLIGSGGIRSGLDAAKAIRLGADVVGQAGALLRAAVEGPDAVLAHFGQLESALRLTCFATGAGDLAALRRVRLL
ncbi:MAG: type 2 isopentenyl-diphosphate Delta-isomerase [Aquimonas sp.]|nr:type 2 isopentenyl-diphosphate Delta-isomerase [Aquimonas sp.]